MRFPRTIRLDTSDAHVFRHPAEAGEWAVPGSFAFAGLDPEALDDKDKLAFRDGWLGLESFGRASLVEVADIDEAAFFQAVERLARHFVECYGAPSLAEALPAARDEADDARSLCEGHKVHTLLALERQPGEDGIVERMRVVRPQRADGHARIWEVVPDDGEASGGDGGASSR